MSPILVRPVREQLEHDRIIRLLQSKFKRRYDAEINPGAEQTAPVNSASASGGTSALFPDVVLYSLERGRRLQGVVEVETAESVNHLEALAEWTNLSRLRAAFYLYVPSSMVDVARRLCEDNQIVANEIWSYHTVGDEVRFTLVHKAKEAALAAVKTVKIAKAPAVAKPVKAPAPAPAAAAKPAKAKAPAARPAAAPRTKAKPAARVRAAKPAARAKPAKKPARVAKRK